MKLKTERFSFEEVVIKILFEANAVGFDESQLIDEIASGCENLTHQNHTVLIAALVGDHNFNGFEEILNFWSKTEITDKIV